jgi:hypothetical protein
LGFPEVREYLRGILGCRRFDFDGESIVNVGVARPRVRFLAAILCEDRDRSCVETRNEVVCLYPLPLQVG